jgi:DNA mismatch endonuclease (patch repair protein)
VADVFSKKKRSEVMSRIRSRGNKDTELAFMHILRQNGIKEWRRHLPLTLHQSRSDGNDVAKKRGSHVRPDFVFRSIRLAVFIDGCFWHACHQHGTKPAGNADFWRLKLQGNRRRDRFVATKLRGQGWAVMRIWEHDMRRPDRVAARLQSLIDRRRAAM